MTLSLRKGIWYYDFIVGGKRHAGSTGLASRAEAQRVEDKLKVQFRAEYSPQQIWEQTRHALCQSARVPLEFDALWKIFVARSLCRACEKKLLSYRAFIREFLEWMSRNCRDVRFAGDVSTDIAHDYIAWLRRGPGAAATKNSKLTILKLLFKSLGPSSGVIENPFEGIAPMKGESVAREIYTPDELRLIGENATGWILDLCLTAISTGLREGDICNLTRECISPDYRWIHLDKVRKTGRPLDIPVLPRLREHLMQAGDGEYIYPELHRLYEVNHVAIGRGLKRFLAGLGIGGTTRQVEGYTRALSVKDVHSFRHTFVYLAACNHIPFPVVQSIVGHASPAMTRIYMDHANGEDKERYLAQLPEYMLSEAPASVSPVQRVIDLVEADAPKAEILSALRAML